jgi:hypothetical protein
MFVQNKQVHIDRAGKAKGDEAFLIWFLLPFYSAIIALRNYQYPWAKNIIWLFIIFYGFTFVASDKSMDSARYIESLKYFAKEKTTSFNEFFRLLYHTDTRYVDVVQPLITFIVSRFTDSGRVLFACFGIVFGYFYSRNVWYMLGFVQDKLKREAIPFLLLFVFVVAIWQLNGFRFYTATHIFVFGLFRIAGGGRKAGLAWCLSSILVHFSFTIPMILLLLHLLIGSRLLLSFFLYFLSFFISQITPESLQPYAKSLPEVFQERTTGYISEEYIKARSSTKVKVNWYVQGRVTALVYATNLVLLFLFFKYRKVIHRDVVAKMLVAFSLLLLALSNLLESVPSVGVRFQMVALMILYAGVFLFVQRVRQKLFSPLIKIPFTAATLLFLIVEIRIGFNTMGVMTVIGNPVTAAFIENDVPLINLIK